MADRVHDQSRLGWLDGLRGFAAMQVVLMHYVFAFLPAVAMTYPLPVGELGAAGLAGIPLVYAFDGSSAVYLFFLMSGVVLTQAFSSRTFRVPSAVMRRLIRLGLPMIAATLFAGALLALLPDAHLAAGERTGSTALRDIGPTVISLYSIAHQIIFEGLLTGFSTWSLLPRWTLHYITLSPRVQGFNVPLWTLHIEFCGSLLVMLLVVVRSAASQGAYRAVCAILGFAFVISPMSLFVIGHLAASQIKYARERRPLAVPGSILLGAGVLLCSIRTTVPIAMLWTWLPAPPIGIQGDAASLQKMIGAVSIFAGLACLPALQRYLEQPFPRWIGKISFSLYLTHYPILYTAVALVFNGAIEVLPYDVSIAVVGVAGIVITITTAVLFERWVDRPSIALSRTVANRFAEPALARRLKPVAG